MSLPGALSRVQGRPWESSVPPPALCKVTPKWGGGGGKEGAIPSRRRGYRLAPALSCWQPAASPASSAPPWRPGPVTTATRTLPVAIRKYFPPPPARPVGESGSAAGPCPAARLPPPAAGKLPPGPVWFGGGPSPRGWGRGGLRPLPRWGGGWCFGPLTARGRGGFPSSSPGPRLPPRSGPAARFRGNRLLSPRFWVPLALR